MTHPTPSAMAASLVLVESTPATREHRIAYAAGVAAERARIAAELLAASDTYTDGGAARIALVTFAHSLDPRP